MSIPEIVEAVRALPRSDRIQVLRTLRDEFGGSVATSPEETLLAKLIASGGTWQIGSQITTDAEGMRTILEAVARNEAKG